METLKAKIQNNVIYLTLNRPQVKNAMNELMIQELKEYFSKFNPEARAFVVRGAEGFFCAGGDLNWMKSSQTKSKEENEADAKELGKMLRAMDECPIPIISVVEGGAFGGGVGLVAASDIVIAENSALFSLSEVKLGLIPATIGPIVMRKIGLSQARRLYLTGLRFSAREAKLIQLVHNVCEAGKLQESVELYLKAISNSGPKAIRRAKSLIKGLMGESLWREDVSESTSKVLSEVRVGEEAQEGISAFLEKRKASWTTQLVK